MMPSIFWFGNQKKEVNVTKYLEGFIFVIKQICSLVFKGNKKKVVYVEKSFINKLFSFFTKVCIQQLCIVILHLFY